MRFLRQNTATIVTVGPFYDKGDGVAIETGLTITLNAAPAGTVVPVIMNQFRQRRA